MKITFINLTYNIKDMPANRLLHPRHCLPPLDIGYCAALLEKQGHEVDFFDTAPGNLSYNDIFDKISGLPLEGIAVIKPNEMAYELTLKLAADLKKAERGSPYIIIIGPVASASFNYFIFKGSPIDLCVIGEPEYTLLEAAERLSCKRPPDQIAGTAYFRNDALIREKDRDYIADLDNLLFPKHSLFIGKGYKFFYPSMMLKRKKLGLILSSRGCPHSCSFCSPVSRISYGKPYRARSAGNVMEEINFLGKLGVNFVYFIDDLFSYDKERLKKICLGLKYNGLRMRWAAQCRIDDLDEQLLRLMKSAGCLCINLGIESGSEKVLNALHKNLNLANVGKTVKLCKKIGISTVGNFILGAPGEEDSDREITVRFAKRVNFDIIEILLFTPYPGSRAFNDYGNPGKINRYCRYDKLAYGENQAYNDKIEKFRKFFYRDYCLRPGFILRNAPAYVYSAVLNGSGEWKFLKKVTRYILS